MMPLLAAIAVVAAPAAATPQEQITAALRDSAAGWDASDLARFMRIYAPDAVYVTGTDVVRGREAIAARYAGSFAAGAVRGKLTLQPLAWRPLSAVHMLHIARWRLTGPDGKVEDGVATMVFERRADGWRIISDHS